MSYSDSSIKLIIATKEPFSGFLFRTTRAMRSKNTTPPRELDACDICVNDIVHVRPYSCWSCSVQSFCVCLQRIQTHLSISRSRLWRGNQLNWSGLRALMADMIKSSSSSSVWRRHYRVQRTCQLVHHPRSMSQVNALSHSYAPLMIRFAECYLLRFA